MTETLWTDEDLAAFLKLSPGTLRNRRMLARKLGTQPNLPPAVRIGASVRYREEDARAFVARHVEGNQLACA